MKPFKKAMLGIAIGATALLGAGIATVQAESQMSAKAEVGLAAPEFKLTTIDGKAISLSDYKGKTVVLMWFSPKCPFVVKHFADKDNQTFNTMYNDYKDKDVVFLAINSAKPTHAYGDVATNKSTIKEWNFQWPVLMDGDGTVGRLYGARTTPEMFVINKDGVIAYHGAIDNDGSPKGPGDVNYVRQALDEVLAGETVSNSETRPYGCSVKY
ncbi:MAG: thioredoxin family protein [Phycisphaerales bacterium]|nr:thioredoxin family protein [Phycisphaerales bacterium]